MRVLEAHELAAVSTAARMALTCYAPSKGRLDTHVEPRLSQQEIRQKLLDRAAAYAADHCIDCIDVAAMEARWKALIPEWLPEWRSLRAAVQAWSPAP